LSVAAAGIEGPGRLPTRLESLVIDMPAAGDAVLDGVTGLESLTLRGTPVGGKLVLALAWRFGLRSLDIVDAAVTAVDGERLLAEAPRPAAAAAPGRDASGHQTCGADRVAI
jgi:hypothetical protein